MVKLCTYAPGSTFALPLNLYFRRYLPGLRIVNRLVILPPLRIFALPIEWNLPPLCAAGERDPHLAAARGLLAHDPAELVAVAAAVGEGRGRQEVERRERPHRDRRAPRGEELPRVPVKPFECDTIVYVPGFSNRTGARPVVQLTNVSVDGPAIAPSGPVTAAERVVEGRAELAGVERDGDVVRLGEVRVRLARQHGARRRRDRRCRRRRCTDRWRPLAPVGARRCWCRSSPRSCTVPLPW